MAKVVNPPPKPTLPPYPGGREAECRSCFVVGFGAVALSGAVAGFLFGMLVGRLL